MTVVRVFIQELRQDFEYLQAYGSYAGASYGNSERILSTFRPMKDSKVFYQELRQDFLSIFRPMTDRKGS